MRKEVCWLYAPCVVLVLKYLVIKPRTPMQLRMLSHIPGNYVNRILKKLESGRIVKCLTPGEKIGKVFCVNPEAKNLVEKALKESGYNLRVSLLPKLNWKAYGRLSCEMCSQLRIVFNKSLILNSRGEAITESNLEKELKNNDSILLIDRSDIYRALKQLRKLELLTYRKNKGYPIEFHIPDDALLLAKFLNTH